MRIAALAAALLLGPVAALAQEPVEVVAQIRSDTNVMFTFPAHERALTWVIHVPPRCEGLVVLTIGDAGDIDLFLRHGAPIRDHRRDPDARSIGPDATEALFLDDSSSPPLKAGPWFLDMVHPQPGTPVEVQLIIRIGTAPGIAYTSRARSRRSEGDLKRALADAERAVQLEPEQPASWEVRAQVKAALGDRAGAAADHARGLELMPSRPAEIAATSTRMVPLSRRGVGLVRLVVPDGCERLRVAAVQPEQDVDLYLRQGLPPEEPARDADHARTSLRRDEQLWLEPGDTPVGLAPGPWYLAVASPRATGPVRISIELDPPGSPSRDPRWWYDRGLMHERSGQHEAALRALTIAVQLAPDDPFTRLARAEALRALSRWKEAASEYGEVLRAAPSFPTLAVLPGRAACLREAGDHEGALRDLDRVAQEHQSPEVQAELHHQRALVRLAAGDRDAALDELDRALRLAPRDWRSLVHRAQLRAARGEREAARQDHEAAMRIAPSQVLAGLDGAIDSPRQLEVALPAGKPERTWVLFLPEQVHTLTLDLRGGPPMKVLLRWGVPPGKGEDGADYEVGGPGDKRVVLSRDSVPPLRPGGWFLRVRREGKDPGSAALELRWTLQAE